MEKHNQMPTWEHIDVKEPSDRAKSASTESLLWVFDVLRRVFTYNLDQGIEHLLPMIQESRRPMHYSTWKRLRQNFLMRGGILKGQSKKYELIIEPHILSYFLFIDERSVEGAVGQ